MGLPLTADRIHEQFTHRSQWRQAWIGQVRSESASPHVEDRRQESQRQNDREDGR